MITKNKSCYFFWLGRNWNRFCNLIQCIWFTSPNETSKQQYIENHLSLFTILPPLCQWSRYHPHNPFKSTVSPSARRTRHNYRIWHARTHTQTKPFSASVFRIGTCACRQSGAYELWKDGHIFALFRMSGAWFLCGCRLSNATRRRMHRFAPQILLSETPRACSSVPACPSNRITRENSFQPKVMCGIHINHPSATRHNHAHLKHTHRNPRMHRSVACRMAGPCPFSAACSYLTDIHIFNRLVPFGRDTDRHTWVRLCASAIVMCGRETRQLTRRERSWKSMWTSTRTRTRTRADIVSQER